MAEIGTSALKTQRLNRRFRTQLSSVWRSLREEQLATRLSIPLCDSSRLTTLGPSSTDFIRLSGRNTKTIHSKVGNAL